MTDTSKPYPRVLSELQFSTIRTQHLGFHYHEPDEPEARAYDETRPDESTRIRQRVNLRELHTVQYSANRERVEHYAQSGPQKPIQVMKLGGRTWVEDGIHRAAAAISRGETRIDAEVALPDRASSPAHFETVRGRGL